MKHILILVVFCTVAAAQTEGLRFARVFTDNMVLQQERSLSFWGRGTPGTKVRVDIGSRNGNTVVLGDGRWSVATSGLKADNKPLTVILREGDQIVATLKNVMMGEVWIVAGQSNMSRPANGKQMDQANYPNLRLFNSSGYTPRESELDWPTGWTVCTPESIKNAGDHWRDPKDSKKVKIRAFSEVGYVFGRTIHEALKIPVGLIQLSAGGSTAKDWTPVPGIEKKYPFGQPAAPTKHKPGLLFHIRMRPLRAYEVRGAVWYQGEDDGRNLKYNEDLKKLIASWRKFNTPTMPFFMAQIGATSYASGMLAVYEAQQWVMDNVPHTGIAGSNDIYEKHIAALDAQAKAITKPAILERHRKHVAGQRKRLIRVDAETGWPLHGMSNPHPPNKELIAKRLGMIALRETYEKISVPVYGPMYDSSWIDGDKIVVKFKHVGDGLKTGDGNPLNWFEISENKRRLTKRKRGAPYAFVKAVATITAKDTIEIRADGVEKPRFVRFAWHMYARHNLVNSAGLPASPFRTERTADPRKR
jgi:sialate O-acetylesterase